MHAHHKKRGTVQQKQNILRKFVVLNCNLCDCFSYYLCDKILEHKYYIDRGGMGVKKLARSFLNIQTPFSFSLTFHQLVELHLLNIYDRIDIIIIITNNKANKQNNIFMCLCSLPLCYFLARLLVSLSRIFYFPALCWQQSTIRSQIVHNFLWVLSFNPRCIHINTLVST